MHRMPYGAFIIMHVGKRAAGFTVTTDEGMSVHLLQHIECYSDWIILSPNKHQTTIVEILHWPMVRRETATLTASLLFASWSIETHSATVISLDLIQIEYSTAVRIELKMHSLSYPVDAQKYNKVNITMATGCSGKRIFEHDKIFDVSPNEKFLHFDSFQSKVSVIFNRRNWFIEKSREHRVLRVTASTYNIHDTRTSAMELYCCLGCLSRITV